MAKIEITTEMVARFRAKQQELYGTSTSNDCAILLLDHALNPPSFDATPDQIAAGCKTFHALGIPRPEGHSVSRVVCLLYHAMKVLEPKPSSTLTPQVLYEGFKDGKMMWSMRMIDAPPAGPGPMERRVAQRRTTKIPLSKTPLRRILMDRRKRDHP